MSQAGPPEPTLALPLPQAWKRLNPLMLLVHPINEVVQFLPAVVAAFLFGDRTGGSGWLQVAAIVVPVLLGLARYLTTAYRINGTQIELRRGLVSRKVLTAPLDRIRTVELTSPVIHRLLGLAKVQIGTGSTKPGAGDKLELDSLARAEAELMRTALLRRVSAASADEPAMEVTTETHPADQVLLKLIPAWARYAPLTGTGLVIALLGFGAVVQFGYPVFERIDPQSAIPVLGLLLLVLGLLAVTIPVLAVGGYLITNWGFTVSRAHGGGSFQISRGLLTTRETNLDTSRVHGVELQESLGLRLAGAAQVDAIATGMGVLSDSSAAVVPAAPLEVAEGVGELVLAERGTLNVPFTGHGSRARRRRWTRALAGGLLLSALWSAATELLDLPVVLHLVDALLLLANVGLAEDRHRRLGHALTDRFVVFRSGSLFGSRTALQRSGIIGWNFEQSWFQRRQGLATIAATTSAGGQSYGVYDVPLEEAVRFADAATPGLLEEFLVR